MKKLKTNLIFLNKEKEWMKYMKTGFLPVILSDECIVRMDGLIARLRGWVLHRNGQPT